MQVGAYAKLANVVYVNRSISSTRIYLPTVCGPACLSTEFNDLKSQGLRCSFRVLTETHHGGVLPSKGNRPTPVPGVNTRLSHRTI